jgi:hypothetical protein
MYSSKMHRKQKNEIPRYGKYGKYGKYGNYGSCKRDVEEIVEYEGRGFERIWREEDIAKTFTADLMIQVLGKYKGVEIFFLGVWEVVIKAHSTPQAF